MSHPDRVTQGTEKPTRRRCVACSHHHHSAAHSPSSHPKSSPTIATSAKTKKTTPTTMANRFIVPDSSPPGSPTPSMPGQTPQRNSGFLPTFGDLPSTTPAGPPPPSSVASFTPAGAPSDVYLGSSIMRSMAGQPSPNFGGGLSRDSTRTNLFGRSEKSNAPLGRSIGPRGRPASGLSRQFNMGDFEPDEDLDEDAEGDDDLPPHQGSLFRSSFAQKHFANREVEDEIERAITRDLDLEDDNYDDEEEEDEEEEEAEDEDQDLDQYEDQESEEDASEDEDGSGDEADMFLNMRHDDRPYGQPVIGEESDLMMLNTPAATSRIRKEAEGLYRRSTALLGSSGRNRGFELASIARDFYTQFDIARLVEPSSLISETESIICRLYDEGVGTSEDEERLDDSLANATFRLVTLWNEFAAGLPKEGERLAYVGPAPTDSSFEKAAYVAQLILRLHHTRFLGDGAADQKIPPVPEALLDWMRTSHNLYPNQAQNVRLHQPSPASHSLFWQTVRNSLLRGELADAIGLLRNAGWEAVTRGPRREPAYTGKALDNVKRFVASCCETLELCPATKSDWDIKNSSWTLFRVQARGARDGMTVFAEGTDNFRNSEDDQARAPAGLSMSTMARKSTSQLPWDIYENLQAVYGIVLGNNEAIIDTAQDWCEATVGMFAWWDEKSDQRNAMRFSQQRDLLASTFRPNDLEGYFDRLSSTFHYVLQSDLVPNTMNPVEVAIASVFEGNVEAVVGFLRAWSLPVACSVAEIASLGRWLPISEVKKPLLMDDFDMEDLEILNIPQPTLDDIQGVKDSTLEAYARQLAGIGHLSPQREGWELAIQVLGRMDATEKSEVTVGELLRDILKTLDENSSSTVDKMWRILNELGLINFAEETAETFADILSQESHRFGEALWYYALSHRTDKVREVLNLLISYSLIQSTVYPAEKDLDEELKNLLRKRGETLERRAEQDLEAAQLLGRMMSGYATLRKFYELRDELQANGLSSSKALALKKQAAFALVAVVSSSDDNIRGGLYDDARDAVVSEDFLLALLGEASVFIHQSPTVITLEQIDILLKAAEDIQTVGSRVYSACEEFFDLVLSSGQGLKGSKPSDLMQKSTMSLGGSYVMSGSSMLTSHFHKSVAAGGTIQRGWDWRREFTAATKAEDVLRKLRLGLAKDLATLWLDDADGIAAW